MKIASDTELSCVVWRKSRRSGGGNQCVELAQVDAMDGVDDSENPGGLLRAVNAFAAPEARGSR